MRRIGTATRGAPALGLNVVFYDPYVEEGRDKALGSVASTGSRNSWKRVTS
ncbi:MAG: hypothetical protein U0794_20050 [Isosphaeraceae bacterium]